MRLRLQARGGSRQTPPSSASGVRRRRRLMAPFGAAGNAGREHEARAQTVVQQLGEGAPLRIAERGWRGRRQRAPAAALRLAEQARAEDVAHRALDADEERRGQQAEARRFADQEREDGDEPEAAPDRVDERRRRRQEGRPRRERRRQAAAPQRRRQEQQRHQAPAHGRRHQGLRQGVVAAEPAAARQEQGEPQGAAHQLTGSQLEPRRRPAHRGGGAAAQLHLGRPKFHLQIAEHTARVSRLSILIRLLSLEDRLEPTKFALVFLFFFCFFVFSFF